MSALSRFEHFVETLLEGSFARLMRSELQPVEVAKRLARAMELDERIGAGKVVAPNEYQVFLSPEDFTFFRSGSATWEQELSDYLEGVARERRVILFGRPIVTLQADPTVSQRQVRVVTKLVDPAPAPCQDGAVMASGQTARIDAAAIRQALAPVAQHARLVLASGSLAGGSFAIDKAVVLIGRGMDNDIVIEDALVSRYHAEIRLRGGRYILRDLKSTNGTRLNGEPIRERSLDDGDRVSIASVELLFQIGS